MRFGVDASVWSTPRGNGRAVRNAVGRLTALFPEDEWTLYVAEDTDSDTLPDGATVHRLRDGRTWALRARGLDAFLSPTVASWFPVFGARTVVGIHDATAMTHGNDVFPSARDRFAYRLKQRLALRSADRLFTITDAARGQIAGHLGVDESAIAVVRWAADPLFEPRSSDAVADALASIGLPGTARPIVTAALTSPHKDPVTLVRAYASLRADGVPPLVMAGAPHRSDLAALTSARNAAVELGVADSVLFPGNVSDEVLAGLFTAATAVVLPSLSEGFGLIAVEAGSCGAAVVLSDIGAHRETMADAGVFFPPGDHEALAIELNRLLSDPVEAGEVARRCEAASARFSWDEAARRLRDLLGEAARG